MKIGAVTNFITKMGSKLDKLDSKHDKGVISLPCFKVVDIGRYSGFEVYLSFSQSQRELEETNTYGKLAVICSEIIH